MKLPFILTTEVNMNICSVTVASAISLLLVHSGCLRIAVLQQTLWSGELWIDKCVTIYIFCY